MTNQQINAAIAKACGWEKWPTGGISKRDQCGTLRLRSAIPDYCNDLNDMHEAEKVLNMQQWRIYLVHLANFLQDACHATAKEKARAFLRTLGKWEEAQP